MTGFGGFYDRAGRPAPTAAAVDDAGVAVGPGTGVPAEG